MAQANVPIQIKRSLSNTPTSLNYGELAFTQSTGALYVGNSTSGVVQLNSSTTPAVLTGVANGTLTASKALIADSNLLLDQVKHGNTTSNTVINSVGINVANSTLTVNVSPGSFISGNSTANVNLVYTSFSIANSTATTTINPTSISTRDLTLSGNLVINGSTTTVNTATIIETDNMIRLAANNLTTDTVDIGFYGSSGNSTVTLFSGFGRTASDGKWRIFQGNTTEPTSTFSTANLAILALGGLELTTALAVGFGGTGKSVFTGNAIVYTTNTTNMAFLSGTAGQVLQIDSGNVPIFAGIDGGTF